MFQMFYAVAIALCITTLFSSRAISGEPSQRVKSAIDRFANDILDKCHLEFTRHGSYTSGDMQPIRGESKQAFARYGSCLLAEQWIPTKPGAKADNTQNHQRFTDDGQPWIDVIYKFKGKSKSIITVACDPSYTPAQKLQAITQTAELGDFFLSFSQTDATLSQIAGRVPDQLVFDEPGRITAEYRTRFGLVTIVVGVIDGVDSLFSAKLTQLATDQYWPSEKPQPLSAATRSALGEHPGGLLFHEHILGVNYDAKHGKPFASLTHSDEYKALGKSMKSVGVCNLEFYNKLSGKDQVLVLRISIAEGATVNSLDPEFSKMQFGYKKGGDVVRRVDGASVDQVAAEQNRIPRGLWLLLSVGVVSVIATIVILTRRRNARTGV